MVIKIGWTTPILHVLQIRVGRLIQPRRQEVKWHGSHVNDNVSMGNGMGQNTPTMMVVLPYDVGIDKIIDFILICYSSMNNESYFIYAT